MRTCITKKTTGLIAAAMVFLFAFSITAPAMAQRVTLNGLLKNSGIAFKLVRLDRTDGFLFGFSFAGKNVPSIIIAPGFQRMLLVQVNGSDMIFQGDGTGKMQIIAADGDIGVALCVLNSVVTFLNGLQTCMAQPTCLFTQIVTLVTSIISCTGGSTTTTIAG